MSVETHEGHDIKYVVSGTWQHPARINADGDLVVEWSDEEKLDIDETTAWCDTCRNRIGSDDSPLNDDWQAL